MNDSWRTTSPPHARDQQPVLRDAANKTFTDMKHDEQRLTRRSLQGCSFNPRRAPFTQRCRPDWDGAGQRGIQYPKKGDSPKSATVTTHLPATTNSPRKMKETQDSCCSSLQNLEKTESEFSLRHHAKESPGVQRPYEPHRPNLALIQNRHNGQRNMHTSARLKLHSSYNFNITPTHLKATLFHNENLLFGKKSP
ncbi:hypothetical protein AOLI_G00238650 [Acnodon oligacanthus]